MEQFTTARNITASPSTNALEEDSVIVSVFTFTPLMVVSSSSSKKKVEEENLSHRACCRQQAPGMMPGTPGARTSYRRNTT